MDLLTRQQKIDAFYRRHLHPQAHADADLHAAIANSDNITQVGTPEQLIERWFDEQGLTPLEHRHGYNCTCDACENCEPLELPPMRIPWSLLLCGLGCWACVALAIARWVR